MNIDNGKQVQLVIPGKFDGTAGVVGNRMVFLSRERLRDTTVPATIDGEACTVRISKPPNYDRATYPFYDVAIVGEGA